MKSIHRSFVITVLLVLPVICSAQSEEQLGKQLANPVASLISVPLLVDYDQNIGPDDDGDRFTFKAQPVIPFSLNEKWNLISRTIVPVIDQTDIFPGSGSQSGLGDTLQSFFFSPKAPTSGGWIWGAGPALLLPTGSDDLLTSDKWGLGPTAVALKQTGPITRGVLANHIWSVAGEDNRADLSNTFVQPFFVYTTPKAVSFTAFADLTYNWKESEWSAPISFGATKVTKLGNQLLSWGAYIRYWAKKTDTDPEEFSFRLQVTLLYPKKG